MNLPFNLLALFGNEDAIVLIGFVLLLHVVQQCVFHIVLVEKRIFAVVLQFAATRQIRRVVISLCYFEFTNDALAAFDQVKTLGHLPFVLNVVSVCEIDLLHIDCDWQQRLIADFLSTYQIKEPLTLKKSKLIRNFILLVTSSSALGDNCVVVLSEAERSDSKVIAALGADE